MHNAGKKMMKMINNDKLYLGENAVFPADPELTGINANVAVVGGTGTGKTVSCVLPMLLHNTDASMVIPVSKKKIIYQTKDVLEANGYNVQIIDFSKGESTIGFNPMAYLKDDNDVANMAHALVGTQKHEDKYWEDVSADVISAMLCLALYLCKDNPEMTPNLSHFMENYKMLFKGKLKTGSHFDQRISFDQNTNDAGFDINTLNSLFQKLEEEYPNNYGSACWNSIAFDSDKTFSSIKSVTNSAVSKITESVVALSKRPDTIDLEKLGKEKTALFLLTSPFDHKVTEYVNLFYSMLIERLMRMAEDNPDGCLDVPVRIVFDDFACGTRISDFEKHISIFRAAGISVMLLLQSESQLEAMYERAGAATILNNCDTYVYMGGNDVQTCRDVADKCNKDLNSILNMDLHRVIIFRRGSEPVFTMRYPTYEDEAFKNMERRVQHDVCP